jgi:hypothetical protein
LVLPPADIFGTDKPTIFDDAGITSVFINTIEFSFFVLALSIIYVATCKNKYHNYFVFICSTIVIIFSFSIASILCILIVFYLFIDKKYRIIFSGIFLVAALLIFLLNFEIIQLLLGMDIHTWIEVSSEYNRIGYFTKLVPEFFSGNVKDIFLGFGYDGELVGRKLMKYANAPITMIDNENNLKYLKDVYWVSILMAEGVITLLLNFYILKVIYRDANKNKFASFEFIIKTFIFIIFFVGFFNQILDIKAFTFCFWICTAIQINKGNFI